MKRPPRSRHLPARNPSSCTNFVVRVWSLLRGLGPASCGAASALFRVALSRAARMPVFTRVRRRFPDVATLLLGEFRGVDDLVAIESRFGVRARVRALGLSSRPGMSAVGLVRGPTLTASAAHGDANPARAWPPARQSSPPPVQLRVLSQLSRWFEVGTFRRDVLGKTPNMFVVRRPYVNVSFTPPAAEINIHCNFRRNIAFGGILQNFRRNPTFGGISQKYAENVLLWRNNPTFKPRRLSFKYRRCRRLLRGVRRARLCATTTLAMWPPSSDARTIAFRR